MKNHLYLFFLFSTSIISSQENPFSQQNIDTISFSRYNKKHLGKIKYSLENNEKLKGWVKYFTFKSYNSLAARENDSAIFYADKAIEYHKLLEINHPASNGLIHKAYYIKGLREYFNSKTLKSIQTLNKALEFTDKYPNSPDNITWRYHILDRLSIIHTKRGDYNLALKASLESMKDSSQMAYQYEAGMTYFGIGILYDYLNRVDSAKYFYRKALKALKDSLLKKGTNYSDNYYNINVVAANNNLGDQFLKDNRVDSTLYYYKVGYKTLVKKGLDSTIMKTNLIRFSTKANYGFVLFKQDRLNKSLILLESVKDSLDKYNYYDREERNVKLKTNSFLRDVYLKKGEVNKAVEIQKETNDYLILYNEENISKQLQLYSVEYELNDKNNSILELTENKEQQNKIISQQKIITIGLGLFLLLLLGFGYLFWRQKKFKNEYEKENLKQRLLRSQMNPHFIGNSMNSIISLVEKRSENTITYINKLSNLFRLVLSGSREEFISLKEEIETIKNYLELQSNFSKGFSFNLSIDQSVKQEHLIVPPMLIQPFIENAIFHGLKFKENGGEIDINFSKSNDGLLLCEINDNGIGYNKNTHKRERKSISTEIVKEQLAILKKKFKVNCRLSINYNNKGAQIELYLPYLLDS